MLIICNSFRLKEMDPMKDHFSFNVIKFTAKKIKDGLGITLPSLIKNTQLKKISLTGTTGAGRIIFLLEMETGQVIPIMVRLKKDKSIGQNMSFRNKRFVNAIEKNIKLAIQDMENGKYEEYELD
jgi:hypothetical protein